MHIDSLINKDKTNQKYWDRVWGVSHKLKIPSRLLVNNLNLMQLIKSKVQQNSKYIEIGCAPGKMLAWVSKVLEVDASGIDYSGVGINRCKCLFEALNLKIDLHETDFFEHSLPLASFDFVTSFGLIEHFDNCS